MSTYELTRARELLQATVRTCEARTRERDDARALLARQAYHVELGRAVDGLLEQVYRLRRRDDLPFELDFAAVVEGLAGEVDELREATRGSAHEAEELRDVLTLALHAIVARGGSVPHELALAERKLRGRQDAMDSDGLTWGEAKAEEQAREAERYRLTVERECDEWNSWTVLSIDGPGAETLFGVPRGVDAKAFEARMLVAVDVLNGERLTVEAMTAKVLAEVEASVERHHDYCWEIWGQETAKRTSMVNDLADALGRGPSLERDWPRVVGEARKLAAGTGSYAVNFVADQTITFLTADGLDTISHGKAKIFGTRAAAEAACSEYLARTQMDPDDGWVEYIEDIEEWRLREDTL